MLEIIIANLSNPKHASDLLMLLNAYACDPMGGAEALSDYTQKNLIVQLQKRPNIDVVLAYKDQQAAGFSICIEGFSTFACKSLLNIHDFAIHKDFRGQGIAKPMLEFIEHIAMKKDCCKITLEVLEGNHLAKTTYQNFGFASYQLDPAMGGAVMLQKYLQ